MRGVGVVRIQLNADIAIEVHQGGAGIRECLRQSAEQPHDIGPVRFRGSRAGQGPCSDPQHRRGFDYQAIAQPFASPVRDLLGLRVRYGCQLIFSGGLRGSALARIIPPHRPYQEHRSQGQRRDQNVRVSG